MDESVVDMKDRELADELRRIRVRPLHRRIAQGACRFDYYRRGWWKFTN